MFMIVLGKISPPPLLLSFLFRAFLQIFDLLGLEIGGLGGLGTKIWRFWDSQTARFKKKTTIWLFNIAMENHL